MYTKMWERLPVGGKAACRTNAKKETLPEGSDRNTASPTESAVCERQGREHSGADCLNSIAWQQCQDKPECGDI